MKKRYISALFAFCIIVLASGCNNSTDNGIDSNIKAWEGQWSVSYSISTPKVETITVTSNSLTLQVKFTGSFNGNSFKGKSAEGYTIDVTRDGDKFTGSVDNRIVIVPLVATRVVDNITTN